MQDTDRWKQDISMVFDNHEGAHFILREIVNNCPDRHELANNLHEFYDSAIDHVLRETPDNTVGHWLVRELCFGIPQSIFDELAYDYWEAFDRDLIDKHAG